MKSAIAICLFFFAALALARPGEDKYTDRYDNVNLEEILDNKKVLGAYIKCMLELGKCAPEGKELRSHIKEALETYCGKCTKAQEAGTRRVIAHLINHEPEYWRQLSLKYDKDRKYVVKYEAELKTIKA